MRIPVIGIPVILLPLLAPAAAAEQYSPFLRHLTIQLSSYHTDATRDFNEVNPGLGLGFSTGIGRTKFELEGDVGFYKNSFSDISVYAGLGVTYEFLRPHPRIGIRFGPIGGLAYYPNAQVFRDAGVPAIGNAVVFAGAAIFARIDDRIELRSRYLPLAGNDTSGILSFEIRTKF